MPTVLILGAGASRPFGFPTGKDLFERIAGMAGMGVIGDKLGKKPDTLFSGLKVHGEYSESTIRKFANELRNSGLLSVDEFLARRQEWDGLGKAAMAEVLLEAERTSDLFGDVTHGEAENWYRLLFSKLNRSFEDFGGNQISVITYNYDRSLEKFLVTALGASFNKPPRESAAMVSTLRIIHLHGQLTPLREFDEKEGLEYGVKSWRQVLTQCASDMKIIHQADEEEPAFREARELLGKAKRVVFLGFGYGRSNLERLKIRELEGSGERFIFGTCLGFSDAERSEIEAYLRPAGAVRLGGPSTGISSFLHECGALKLMDYRY